MRMGESPMKLRLASLAVVLALVGAFVLAPLTVPVTQAQTPPPPQTNPFLNIPVSGPLGDSGATFTGTMNITGFELGGRNDRRINAVGTLTGEIRNAAGAVVGTLTNFPVTSQVQDILQQPQPGTCPILHLVLGPINLNLLGLVLTTNQIVIDLSAVPGPGNLLGNLLCAIVGLLDRQGNPLRRFAPELVDLLNGVLAALPQTPPRRKRGHFKPPLSLSS
jgi:hypothetical protein